MPFQKCHSDLPVHLSGTLKSWGITPDYAGAGLLKEMWSDEDDHDGIIESILMRYPEGMRSTPLARLTLKQTLSGQITRLAHAAMRSKNLDDMDDWQIALHLEAQRPPPVVIETIPNHFLDSNLHCIGNPHYQMISVVQYLLSDFQ